MKSRDLVIFGSGGHALSTASVAKSAGYRIRYFIDSTSSLKSLLGVSILRELTLLKNFSDFSYAVGIGDNHTRRSLVLSLTESFPNLDFPELVHSSSIICEGSSIGKGSLIMPGVIVGSMTKVGNFCILNTNSSIDHESKMEDFSSIAPGVITGGRVLIGTGSAISIGATIKHGVSIGRDTIVGANSYVSANIPALQVVYGTPARFIRHREPSDSYLH